jgi:hypothetical protein
MKVSTCTARCMKVVFDSVFFVQYGSYSNGMAFSPLPADDDDW